jgi:hypothetical protein
MEKIARAVLWCVACIEINPQEKLVAQWVRTGARIILELLRNMLVVGALQYLAQKTRSPVLQTLAAVGFSALFIYCVAFAFVWSIKLPFSITKNSRVYAFVWGALHAVIVGVSYGLIFSGILSAVNAVMKAQAS